jgi:hypothetical protein
MRNARPAARLEAACVGGDRGGVVCPCTDVSAPEANMIEAMDTASASCLVTTPPELPNARSVSNRRQRDPKYDKKTDPCGLGRDRGQPRDRRVHGRHEGAAKLIGATCRDRSGQPFEACQVWVDERQLDLPVVLPHQRLLPRCVIGFVTGSRQSAAIGDAAPAPRSARSAGRSAGPHGRVLEQLAEVRGDRALGQPGLGVATQPRCRQTTERDPTTRHAHIASVAS